MTDEAKQLHEDTQCAYFDRRASTFVAPIPEFIQEKTRRIARAAGLSESAKVMDVGCGAGVLIGHFLEDGLLASNIVGCDLSVKMLENARSRNPEVYFFHGSVTEFAFDSAANFPPHIANFDAVFFNACFGNMFDQLHTINHVHGLLVEGGSLVISHPLGAGFVLKLHTHEPEIVPNLLPSQDTLKDWCEQDHFHLSEFVDHPDFYLAILTRL